MRQIRDLGFGALIHRSGVARPSEPVASYGRDGQAQTHGGESRLPIFEGSRRMEWGRQEGEKTTGRGRNHGGVGKTRPDARPAGSGGRDGIPPRPFRNIRELFRKFGKSSVSRPFRMTNAQKLPQMNRQPSCIRVYFFSPLQYTAHAVTSWK